MNFYLGMKHLWMLAAALLVGSVALRAQNQGPQTPEQKEKQLLEFIDKEVKRLSDQLELEYWQEFYVDSTLTHDYHALQEELDELQHLLLLLFRRLGPLVLGQQGEAAREQGRRQHP